MARACPACSRPNGDAATKCLYCSEALEPQGLERSEDAGVAPSEVALSPPAAGQSFESKDQHLVVLIPGAKVEDALVEHLATLGRFSAYEARLALQSGRPRIFRRFEDERDALALSTGLDDVAIPHAVLAEARVHAMPIARTRRADFHERHFDVVVEDKAVTVRYEELLLLVRGEILRENHDDKRIGTTKSVARRLTPGHVLHIYRKDASLAIEVDPEQFSWPEDGPEAGPSAILNLERFVEHLASRASSALVDRAFGLEPAVLARAGADNELSHMLADTAPRRGGGGVLHDNGEQFRFYSRWRYQLEQHLARG